MNYYIFRIIIRSIIGLILFTIYILYLKKGKNKKNYIKNKSLMSKIMIAIIVLHTFIPIEYLFLKFKTIDDTVKFYKPGYKIIRKYEFDDYAYVLSQKGIFISVNYYTKKNNYWNIDNVMKQGNFKNQKIIKDDVEFSIYKIHNKNSVAIMTRYYTRNHGNDVEIYNKEIKDDLSSQFTTILEDMPKKKVKCIYQFTVLNEKVDNNYTITIYNKKYNPFDFYTVEDFN